MDAGTASDSDTDEGSISPENTDSHSDNDDDEPPNDDIYVEELEDSIVSGCICRAFGKAHTRDCPLNRTHRTSQIWGQKKPNPRAKDPSAAL